MQQPLRYLFTSSNILNIIETYYLSVTALDEEGNIVGFCAFNDIPQGLLPDINSKKSYDWLSWFHEVFDLPDINTNNSVWLT